MRLLLTNDDGINAEGIRVVADWAKGKGHVTVCAPKVEQSAKSHAINIHTPSKFLLISGFDILITFNDKGAYTIEK